MDKSRLFPNRLMSTPVEKLNYHNKAWEKYDEEIANAIPGHQEMHEVIRKELAAHFTKKQKVNVLELGIGTGLTSTAVFEQVKVGKYIGVDFSSTMLEGAKKRLTSKSIELVLGDYSQIGLPKNADLVISVIGIHHQPTDDDKKKLFAKIYNCLEPNGMFVFGDLMTSSNEQQAALNEARHFHHLVENATDDQTLTEWAHHHKFLNHLAPVEAQIAWLKEVGFSNVKLAYSKFNTNLIIAIK